MRRCRVLEAPIHAYPARAPRLEAKLLRRLDMLQAEYVEVLASKDVGIALDVNLLHLDRQGPQLQPVVLAQMRVVCGQGWHKCELLLDGLQFLGEVSVVPVGFGPLVADTAPVCAANELRPLDPWPAQAQAEEIKNLLLVLRSFVQPNSGKLRR